MTPTQGDSRSTNTSLEGRVRGRILEMSDRGSRVVFVSPPSTKSVPSTVKVTKRRDVSENKTQERTKRPLLFTELSNGTKNDQVKIFLIKFCKIYREVIFFLKHFSWYLLRWEGITSRVRSRGTFTMSPSKTIGLGTPSKRVWFSPISLNLVSIRRSIHLCV